MGKQGSDDFLDRGHVVFDVLHCFSEHRPHTLSNCQTAKLLGRGPSNDEPTDLGSDLEELVDSDPVAVARPRAVAAAHPVEERGLLAPTGMLTEHGQFLGAGRVRLATVVAHLAE